VGSRGGDWESEIEGESETERDAVGERKRDAERERDEQRGGESETERERCCRREKERCRERERERERGEQREDSIDGGPAPEEQEAMSGSGSSTGGRRCDFRWPEPISGEAGMVRQFLWSGDHIWSGDLVLSAFWFNRRW
jgi:hypothetical protein